MDTSQQNSNIQVNIQAGTVFKMIISILITFTLTHLLVINDYIVQSWTLIIGLIVSGVGIALGLLKRKTVGFYVISCALGVILFATTENRFIDISHNLVPPQAATIRGEVCQIIKQTPGKQRLIVEGTIDAKHFPPLTNTKVMLTIIGQKQAMLGSQILCLGNITVPTNKVFAADFDERNYLHNYGASVKGWTYAQNVTIFPQKNSIKVFINSIVRSIESKIDTLFTASTANFVKAILLANKSDLDPEVRRNFQIAGVAHILAVSGFHLGVIATIIWFVISFVPFNRWLKLLVFCAAIVAFCVLTNLQPPVIRAGAMAIIFMLGKTMQRQTNWLNVVSIVLLGTIILSPWLLYSVSFQLSLLSVLGIFLCYDVFYSALCRFKFRMQVNALAETLKRVQTDRTNSLLDYLKKSIAITLSASIIITPLVVYYFNMFSLISPLTNIVIIPLFSLGLLFAVISIIFSFIFFPLGQYYAYNVEMLTNWCYDIVAFAADFQYSSIVTNNVILSIILSFLLFYCVLSKHKKQLLFRVLVSFFVVSMSFYLLPNSTTTAESNSKTLQLYVKYNYNLLSIPLSDGTQFVWLADKKPHTKYYNDVGLIQYFCSNNVKYIGINGNFGQTFVKENDSAQRYSVRCLSFLQQRELEKRYLKGKYMAQMF